MKITSITAVPFRLPVRREFRWATLIAPLGGFVYVRVETDDGIVGHGEATPLPDWGGDGGKPGGETQRTVVAVIEEVIAPVLTGLDPTAIEAAHMAMDGVLRGNSYARNAVDMALHDIWGKAVGQPLYRLLGGAVRDRVPIAHMLGLMSDGEAIEEIEGALADGVTALQIKGGIDADRDVSLVREVRRLAGPDVFLRLDANQGYGRAKSAARILERLREAGVDMVEQPALNRSEMSATAALSDVDILADESCWDAADAIRVAEERCADGISIYLAKAGGISAARRVAAVAQAAALPCDVNGSIESGIGNAANLHFALAMRPVTLAAVIPINAPAGRHPCRVAGNYYTDDVVTEPFPVEGTQLLPLERPGLGIEVDMGKIEAFRDD